MYHLKPETENRDIELLPGIVFTVRPLRSFDLSIARQEAANRVQAVIEGAEAASDAAQQLVKDFDPDNQVHIEALAQVIFVQELGIRAIAAWRGILDADSDTELPPTPERIRLVLTDFALANLFWEKISARPAAVEAAKKNSMTARSGISAKTQARDTATAAKRRARTAQKEKKA